jgi:hypothetical protein
MSATGLIYSLVSRGHETILSSYSAYGGNFPNVALDVLFYKKYYFRYYIDVIFQKLLDNLLLLIIISILLLKKVLFF